MRTSTIVADLVTAFKTEGRIVIVGASLQLEANIYQGIRRADTFSL